MDKQQIELVRQTFGKIEPIAQQVGELFYDLLFAMDPSLKPLFKGDIKAQATMLMTAIGMAVSGLDKPEQLMPQIRQLGQRHIGYGTMPTDFDRFSAALLRSLEQTLGEAFTPEVKTAWIEAFQFITSSMKLATVG